MEISEVKRLYTEELWTLRRIAEHFNTNHHRIKRMLIAGGVTIDNTHRFRAPFTEERKIQIGKQSKGRIPWNKGVRANEQQIRKMMKARMRTNINLDIYSDLNKLQFLVNITSKHMKHLGINDEIRKSFLDKFYFDKQFNEIYNRWQETNENKWYYPSLDHKTSKFNDGNWDLNNLQFFDMV